jgi:CTP:molybdopterin cytidylyltransferase MocA
MFDCVIAAGGRASRLGGSRPKSLLVTSIGANWLTLTVQECVGAGFNSILVAQNRAEWLDETNNVLAKTGLDRYCHVYQDTGFDSTVRLLSSFTHFLQKEALFIYGHAPRQRTHLLKLRHALLEYAVAFTGVRYSTRSHPTRVGDVYLEPPVMLNFERVDIQSLGTWAGVWAATTGAACIINVPGPGEFNTSAESKIFEKFVLPRISRDAIGQA